MEVEIIALDYNQVAISGIMMSLEKNKQIEEDFARHIILNTIRSIRTKFKGEYDELVLCCDSTNYWRKTIFPYYKGLRKKEQGESEFDWNEIFRILKLVRREIALVFPYRVLIAETCEADDIIAILARSSTKADPVLIVSGDGDFVQLHTYPGVKQYDTVRKSWVTVDDPKRALEVKILRGDRGDSIPNVLSEDSSVVLGIRQKPMTDKRIIQFLDDKDIPEDVARRIERNRNLIDLSKIPPEIVDKINKVIAETKPSDGSQLFQYFTMKNLRNLMEDINSFV